MAQRTSVEVRTWKAAITMAERRIKLLPEKQIRENLSYAAGSIVEAYQLGIEEAQGEILGRLDAALRQAVLDQTRATTGVGNA